MRGGVFCLFLKRSKGCNKHTHTVQQQPQQRVSLPASLFCARRAHSAAALGVVPPPTAAALRGARPPSSRARACSVSDADRLPTKTNYRILGFDAPIQRAAGITSTTRERRHGARKDAPPSTPHRDRVCARALSLSLLSIRFDAVLHQLVRRPIPEAHRITSCRAFSLLGRAQQTTRSNITQSPPTFVRTRARTHTLNQARSQHTNTNDLHTRLGAERRAQGGA